MTLFPHADYARLVDDTLKQIQSLSTLKGGEYAGDQDRLANFRRNGVQLGLPMETIWAIYYNKHHDSVMQFVNDINNGVNRVRAEPISGRVDDMITYLILFKAMLVERGELKRGELKRGELKLEPQEPQEPKFPVHFFGHPDYNR